MYTIVNSTQCANCNYIIICNCCRKSKVYDLKVHSVSVCNITLQKRVFTVNFCLYFTVTCRAYKITVGHESTCADPRPIIPLPALTLTLVFLWPVPLSCRHQSRPFSSSSGLHSGFSRLPAPQIRLQSTTVRDIGFYYCIALYCIVLPKTGDAEPVDRRKPG